MAWWSLTARYLFPVDRPPLPQGILTIADDKIAAVEPHGTRSADIDLGNAAILPGLVNAHTHLDLTGLRGQCPPAPDFTQWLRGVIAHRRKQTPEQIAAEIHTGMRECRLSGTTLLGDITAQGQSWSVLATAPMRSVVFCEMLGTLEAQWQQSANITTAWLDSCHATATCRPGLSPHAPYSTQHILYQGAAQLAAERSLPLATHLAETAAELEFLATGTGPFVDFLKELQVWNRRPWTCRLQNYVQICDLAATPFLLVHCNYCLPQTLVVPKEGTIVYCPRTHAAFGHPPHPFRDFLKRGVRVALGTDSLASNPDLDMLAEMRFVHTWHPDLPGDVLLRMGTLAGAEALGWADETGSLTPGKSADLVVVPLPNEEGDPHHLLWKSPQRVAQTLFRGSWTGSTGDPLPNLAY
jgi:cytosine/adenosine deaminase-related metal-dependent hydrolase